MSTSAETINMRTDAERAKHVIASSRSTILPADFFDDFFDTLVAEPIPTLVQAAGRLSKSVRRGG